MRSSNSAVRMRGCPTQMTQPPSPAADPSSGRPARGTRPATRGRAPCTACRRPPSAGHRLRRTSRPGRRACRQHLVAQVGRPVEVVGPGETGRDAVVERCVIVPRSPAFSTIDVPNSWAIESPPTQSRSRGRVVGRGCDRGGWSVRGLCGDRDHLRHAAGVRPRGPTDGRLDLCPRPLSLVKWLKERTGPTTSRPPCASSHRAGGGRWRTASRR